MQFDSLPWSRGGEGNADGCACIADGLRGRVRSGPGAEVREDCWFGVWEGFWVREGAGCVVGGEEFHEYYVEEFVDTFGGCHGVIQGMDVLYDKSFLETAGMIWLTAIMTMNVG